jgi:hypothetical protein
MASQAVELGATPNRTTSMFKVINGLVYPYCERCKRVMDICIVLDSYPPSYSYSCDGERCNSTFGSDKSMPMSVDRFMAFRARQLHLQVRKVIPKPTIF